MTSAEPPRAPSLARIFAAFLWLGGTSFGGGMAGWLYREFVVKRRWIDDRDFLTMLGIGQVLPGSNGIKLTVLIGQRLGGAAGAAVALTGLFVVPFAAVLAIGAVYAGIGEHRIVQAILAGVAAVVTGLTFATGLASLARGSAAPAAWTIAAAVAFSVGVLRWPMLPVIAALTPVSIALALIEPRRR